MSLSDLLNISRTVRRDKAQQQDLLPVPTSSTSTPARLCNICYARPAGYNCPRCNIPYCSLVCFRRKEHEECSSAFASSEISVASGSNVLVEEERERRKVVDILGRLESGEREARERQEDEEDSSEVEDGDEGADVRVGLTAEDIEGASTDALLAMLTPKERVRFLAAASDPAHAKVLMERLDRKAERRARLDMASKQQGVLIASTSDVTPRQARPTTQWQTSPWFEKAGASPAFSRRSTDQISSFVAALAKILSARDSISTKKDSPAPVNLGYNLCTFLMAHAYTLRKMDIESLSEASNRSASSTAAVEANATHSLTSVFEPPNVGDHDDDEPPPLEPDSPTIPAATLPSLSSNTDSLPTPAAEAQILGDPNLFTDVFTQLSRLASFIFEHPSPSGATSRASSSDHSKVLLTSLDESSMWLLSRLSLESEIGHGGADALSLQLLEDLEKLLSREQLVPTFSSDQEVEPKYILASKLASLSLQQAFVAAQTPLLLNAVADLYFFLEDLSVLAASKPALSADINPKAIKLSQRKLCFYFCNALPRSQTLLAEVQASIHSLRLQIGAASQADKLAAAISLADTDHATTSPHVGIAIQE
ncbi:Zinc finger, HIT-type [Kalmanozyma brasiliensis GHG001]|uniref:Zinc finger, HIT-type n=1 Tax=Kalmanozyma brasiliensis (strain GHG001) TaxID=1365824 RepID=UPI002867D9E8|nr:Zinc finger, HIT-type [Kalmanozyma brasiliensis GHG001]KAF6766953.1 Zinc finger, HIT-type [Kalmanozyma brasiliensis GHG001]